MSAGFDLSGALLSVTWQSVGSHQVLAVLEDRTVWYWAMATLGAGSDVVGSFRSEVPPDRWQSITAVAEAVGGGDAALPGALGLMLGSRDRTGWVELGSDEAGRIGAAVLPLLALAKTTPVAAARLETRVVTAPTGQRIAGFTLASIGEQAVSLRLDPQEFSLVSPGGERWPLRPPRMGLVDATGALLDGIYHTATIPPGNLGACTIVLTDPAAEPAGQGAVRGWLSLAGPWPAGPVEVFEASSAVRH